MNKSAKIAITVIAVIIALCVLISGIFVFAFKDKISLSEKNIIANTVLFTHNTEKGEKLEVKFGFSSNKIDEDTYLVEGVFNVDPYSDNYSIKNTRVISNLNNKVNVIKVNVITDFSSADGPNYTLPNIDYPDEQKKVQCFSENGYLHFYMLLSSEQLDNVSFDVEYDIIGEGLYSNNMFHQSWEDLEFVLV